MRRPPREIVAVGTLLAGDAVAIGVTYARIPARQLYDVSGGGATLGLARVLVFLNFPVALAAIAVLLLALRSLPRRLQPLALLGILLCAVVAWPGVVKQSDLDARWINVVPAAGVLLACVLAARARIPRAPARVRGDAFRLALGALLVLVAAPWIAAENGFYLDGVPALGRVFQTQRLVSQPGVAGVHHAVHHGHHHGMDGLLLALTALLLSRLLPVARSRLAAAYLSLMLVYGVANMANDDWLEQVVERGWTTHALPSMLQPAANAGWLGVLVAAALVWALWLGRRPRGHTPVAAATG